jgi:hypothetical protein
MDRRNEKERVRIFNEWSGEEKTWLDYLDGSMVDLLVEGEAGRFYLKGDRTDEENKLYWKWERRSKDPAYQRMREVIAERVKRRTEKWYTRLLKEIGPFILPAIFLIIARNDFNHTEWLIIFLAYIAARGYILIKEHLRDIEEKEIIREWDLHQKVDRVADLLDDISRDQYRASR